MRNGGFAWWDERLMHLSIFSLYNAKNIHVRLLLVLHGGTKGNVSALSRSLSVYLFVQFSMSYRNVRCVLCYYVWILAAHAHTHERDSFPLVPFGFFEIERKKSTNTLTRQGHFNSKKNREELNGELILAFLMQREASSNFLLPQPPSCF